MSPTHHAQRHLTFRRLYDTIAMLLRCKHADVFAVSIAVGQVRSPDDEDIVSNTARHCCYGFWLTPS